MKLRRRDPHHLFLPEGYHTIKHDGSDKQLKKFRTMASMNSLKTQTIPNNNKNQSQPNKSRTFESKQSKLKRKSKKHQSTKLLGTTTQITNVNSYKHLTTVPYINNAQIKWAFGLRNHQASGNLRSVSQVPSTYYKTTQSSKNHHETSQIPSRLNFNTFLHLARMGQYPSMGTLKFEATLRQPSQQVRRKSPQMIQKQKKFDIIPVKDHNDYPKLLNAQSIKKKTINPEEDLQSAFDGSINFPSYSNRIVKQKNYNNLRQYIKNPQRGKINLPSIGWQTNLRFYEDSRNNLKKEDSSIESKNKIN